MKGISLLIYGEGWKRSRNLEEIVSLHTVEMADGKSRNLDRSSRLIS